MLAVFVSTNCRVISIHIGSHISVSGVDIRLNPGKSFDEGEARMQFEFHYLQRCGKLSKIAKLTYEITPWLWIFFTTYMADQFFKLPWIVQIIVCSRQKYAPVRVIEMMN